MPSQPVSQNHIPGVKPWVGTKIVATIGPASCSTENVTSLIRAGANVLRLNFSHGSLESHQKTLDNIRSATDKLKTPVAILGDLCGPKIRLEKIENDSFEIRIGDSLHISRKSVLGNSRQVSINQPDILNDIDVGQRILIDDGNVRLKVVNKDPDGLDCQCVVSGKVSNNKGINCPDSDIQLSALTERDLECARWAANASVDYLAFSFVRNADEVHQLRKILDELDSDIPIVSKIETPQAIKNIEAIINASDAILVARGDLGVEMDVESVPFLQKDIVERCQRAGKPVIVATQMLQSMVDSPVPTRAEVSDVANAIIDGADAVMLSAETAVGRFPVETIQVINRIAAQTERYDQNLRPPTTANSDCEGITCAIARGLEAISSQTNPEVVAVWTKNGELAQTLSKHRLDKPVLAMTPSPATLRRLSLSYGIIPRLSEKPETEKERIKTVDRILLTEGWVKSGDTVVMGLGPQSLEFGDTGSITIHAVSS